MLNKSGSLSPHTIISCGIKLLRILRIVLLKILTFSLTIAFENALSQLNYLMARSGRYLANKVEDIQYVSSIFQKLSGDEKLSIKVNKRWWSIWYGCRFFNYLLLTKLRCCIFNCISFVTGFFMAIPNFWFGI